MGEHVSAAIENLSPDLCERNRSADVPVTLERANGFAEEVGKLVLCQEDGEIGSVRRPFARCSYCRRKNECRRAAR